VSASLAHAAPMRFLIGVAAAWTIVRGVAIAGWAPPPPPPPGRAAPPIAGIVRHGAAWRPFVSVRGIASRPSMIADMVPALLRRVAPARMPAPAPEEFWRSSTEPLRSMLGDGFAATQMFVLAAYGPATTHGYRRGSGIVDAGAVTGEAKHPARFSGSAWAFVRGGGRATASSPVGQIGGGQTGARLLYRIDKAERLAVSARVSGTIGGIHQTEAAVGLDWKPIDTLPVHLMLDRRIAIDKGGRDAWTLGAAGGVDDVRIAPGWRLDGYAEAGVVGARRRDLYADGAARIARAIDLGSGRSLAVGAGVWGAAQPGAARLDAGPSVVLRAPVAGHVVAVALDWRERMVGAAKPGSGIALTVATDF
jgi:hypothetical protein